MDAPCSLLSALPEHLHTLLTTTLQSHTLKTWDIKTWDIKDEAKTNHVVYSLVFRQKEEDEEDNRSQEGKDLVSGSSLASPAVERLVEEAERKRTQNKYSTSTGRLPIAATGEIEAPVPARLGCVADYEEHCRRSMSKSAWLYFSDGAMTGATIQRNKDAFKNILISPKLLVNVSNPDLTYTIRATGETVALPIGISPTAFHLLATPEGELATVGAAQEAGVVYVSSIHASTKLEDIAATKPQATRWQQHILLKDPNNTEDVVRRAEKAGVTAIVLSIDKTASSRSWNRMRGIMNPPKHLMFANFSVPVHNWENSTAQYSTESTWDDVKWFCEMTSLPVIIKGVMTVESAQMAVQVGAKGVIVSNHGGRALDTVPATMEVLRDIVAAVGDQLEVFVDGGVMTGLDVFKALAYGAQMVFIGRSAIWGLAQGGQAGLCHVIDILKEELLNAMKLAGTPTLKDITMDRIYKQL